MKLFTTAALISAFFYGSAQNVGIGTTSPLMALHVAKPTDTALALLENQSALATGTNTGLYFKNGSYYTGAVKTIGNGTVYSRLSLFTYANSNPNGLHEGFTMLDDGTVGIGNINPVNGGLVVDKKTGAVNALFGSNTTGVALESANPGLGLNTFYNFGRKFISNGYGGLLGLNPANGYLSMYVTPASGNANAAAAMTEAVTIDNNGQVGIGAPVPGAKLHVAGSVKIADGSEGNGKVLTSDDAGNASWKASAYGNLERFSFDNRYNGAANVTFTTNYATGTTNAINDNGASTTLRTTRMNIFRAGLYHFSIAANADIVSTSAAGQMIVSVFENSGAKTYVRSGGSPYFSYNPQSNVLSSVYDKEIDIYIIQVPTILYVQSNLYNGGATFTTINHEVIVTGNLIAD